MIRAPLFPQGATPRPSRHLLEPLRAMYGVAAAFAAVPGVRVAAQLIPMAPLSVAWRYEAYGLATGAMLAPVGALVLTHWVAGLLEQRRIQFAAATAAAAFGGVLLLGAPLFVADYLRVRSAAPEGIRGAIDGSAWRSLIQAAALGPALLWLGVAGVRSALTPPAGQIKKRGGAGGLVIAQKVGEDVSL